jgi:thermitase
MAKRMLVLSCLVLALVSVCTGAAAQETVPAGDPASIGPEYVPEQLLIRFQPSVSGPRADQILAERGASRLGRVRALDIHLLHLPPHLSVERAAEVFSRLPEVAFAEPNYILHLVQVDDPGLGNQWAPQAIEAPAAWGTTTGDPSVTIAVVDTGIDYLHSELASNVWANPEEIGGNSLDDDGNGYIDDVHGWDFANSDSDPMDDHSHGTHVAGIAAAVDSANPAGLVGICPACTLMAVKVLDASGSASLAVVADGITYAADEGARVINLSLGGPIGTSTLELAVNYAWGQGAVVVAAAGNDGVATTFYPAGYANAIGVASTNVGDYRSCFSNYGSSLIAVAAPGESIYSTLPRDTSGVDRYGMGSGTSMAAPHVSGLAGLLFSETPTPTNDMVRSRIESTAEDLGPTGVDAYFGAGRINAWRAVMNDTSLTIPPTGLFSDSLTASGYAHARKLARDGGGTLHLAWHGMDGDDYRVLYATSMDGGDTWSAPQVVFSSPEETYHPALAVDGANVYIAFPSKHGGALYQTFFTSRPLSGGSWTPAQAVMGGTYDVVRPDLFVDPSNSRLHLVASSLDNAPYVYYTTSSDGGVTWRPVQSVNPAPPTMAPNTRYAAVHASGSNVYIAARTMAGGIFTTYYLHTVRSTDGGQTWFDQTQISSYLAWQTGEYGVSLAGVGDRLYMAYEVGGGLYFRRFDGAGWSDYLQLESSARWPTVTQADDGQAWLIWEDAGSLLMRHYTGTSWEPAETLLSADVYSKSHYPNLKLGTSGGRVEWVATHCSGAPFRLVYDGRAAGANGAPVASDVAAAGDEDTVIGWTPSASDPEADALTCTVVSHPSHGTASVASCASGTYTPEPDYNGTDSFTYKASDGSADSNVATVTIIVYPVQDAPDASDDSASVAEDGATDIDVLSNDGDRDGDPLTVISVSAPAHGAATINADGTIHYEPGPDFSGPDSFTYTISDGNGGSDGATVAVVVEPVNDPPIAQDDAYSVEAEGTLAVGTPGVLGNDADLENDPLSTIVNSDVSHGTLALNPDGSFSYAPASGFAGADSFTYRASDGVASSNVATVIITVSPSGVHVGDLDGAAAPIGKKAWRATVTIAVHDAAHNPVADATVSGMWSGGYTGGASCVTLGDGRCSVPSSKISSEATTTFVVDDVGHATLTYQPGDNHDDEGDSDGSTITVALSGNQSPVAAFTYVCTGLACDFAASSSADPDGSITGYDWAFGDGSIGGGVLTSHTYGSAGVYAVTLTVTDSEGATGIDSQTVTVGTAGGTMHIADLDGTYSTVGSKAWRATVAIAVDDAEHNPVANATVSGSWSDGLGAGSCTTDASGLCNVTSGKILNTQLSVTFAIEGVSHATLTYQPGDNRDPDDDSNGTSINVSGP